MSERTPLSREQVQQPSKQTILFVAEELHQAEMQVLIAKQNVSAAEFQLDHTSKRVEQIKRVLEARRCCRVARCAMSERAPLSREQVVEAIRIHELAVSEGLYESTDLTLMLAQDCLTYMDELATAVEMFNQMFNQANREYGEIAVERDSYMAALEQIAKYPSAIGGTATILQDIARAAIKGKEVSSANS